MATTRAPTSAPPTAARSRQARRACRDRAGCPEVACPSPPALVSSCTDRASGRRRYRAPGPPRGRASAARMTALATVLRPGRCAPRRQALPRPRAGHTCHDPSSGATPTAGPPLRAGARTTGLALESQHETQGPPVRGGAEGSATAGERRRRCGCRPGPRRCRRRCGDGAGRHPAGAWPPCGRDRTSAAWPPPLASLAGARPGDDAGLPPEATGRRLPVLRARERLRPPPPRTRAPAAGDRSASRRRGRRGRLRTPGASCTRTGWPGPLTLVVVGLMPAWRVRSRTSPDLLVGHQGDDGALVAGARRTARAVQVGLVLDRRVGVDDERHVVDVDAARGDVGRDQRGGGAGVERLHVAGARVLRQVAVQLDAGHAALVELAGERLGAVLGAREDDRAARGAGEVDQDRDALLAREVQHVVVHRRDRRLRRVGLVRDRRWSGSA